MNEDIEDGMYKYGIFEMEVRREISAYIRTRPQDGWQPMPQHLKDELFEHIRAGLAVKVGDES